MSLEIGVYSSLSTPSYFIRQTLRRSMMDSSPTTPTATDNRARQWESALRQQLKNQAGHLALDTYLFTPPEQWTRAENAAVEQLMAQYARFFGAASLEGNVDLKDAGLESLASSSMSSRMPSPSPSPSRRSLPAATTTSASTTAATAHGYSRTTPIPTPASISIPQTPPAKTRSGKTASQGGSRPTSVAVAAAVSRDVYAGSEAAPRPNYDGYMSHVTQSLNTQTLKLEEPEGKKKKSEEKEKGKEKVNNKRDEDQNRNLQAGTSGASLSEQEAARLQSVVQTHRERVGELGTELRRLMHAVVDVEAEMDRETEELFVAIQAWETAKSSRTGNV